MIDTTCIGKFGFELLDKRKIVELDVVALLVRHQASGAQLLSLHNDDENKVFGITFKTPPSDSTGVAHVMEHSVLCGSEKYPVKEPFVELLKGSLQTFLNAFTFPDKTCYPVASQHLVDFYNLVDVYLDSVFFPRIGPETLKQEGWHLERPEANRLVFKGVVFNEMKGAYSNPSQLLYQRKLELLYPDTPYRHSSGGDPAAITDLTYEQFKSFHETYYHPSNALLFFYGDSDLESRLASVAGYLNRFSQKPPAPEIPLQTPLGQPREAVYSYDAGAGDIDNKSIVALSWLLPENSDPQLVMNLTVLSEILLGSSASPLRKALTDSHLGESVISEGLSSSLRQMSFSVGMRNVARQATPQVAALIRSTLADICQRGIDQAVIMAALHQIEFALVEQDSGHYPRGLMYMLRSLESWLHGGDPLAAIAFRTFLEHTKQQASIPGFFEGLIERHLIANRHQVTITMHPERGYAAGVQAMEDSKLAILYNGLNDSELEIIDREAQQLAELQQKPDDPAELAKLPKLQISELSSKCKSIPKEVYEVSGSTMLVTPIETRGVCYANLVFDLSGIPAEHIAYLPLFAKALFQLGTVRKDFAQLVGEINTRTGGIDATPIVLAKPLDPNAKAYLLIRGKVLHGEEKELFRILNEVVQEVNLNNRDRFLKILRQYKVALDTRLVSSGHTFAARRLAQHYHQSGWLEEELQGVQQMLFVRQVEQLVLSDWDQVKQVLYAIRAAIFRASGVVTNITTTKSALSPATVALEEFLSKLPPGKSTAHQWPQIGKGGNEGIVIPSLVNYVAKGTSLFDHGYQAKGSMKVISKYLGSDYLWNQVRVLGGAYGAFCSFDRATGLFTLSSYRDPNLDKTLETFDQAGEYLKDVSITGDDLRKAIIGAIGAMDTHLQPDDQGYTSLVRHLIGRTDAALQLDRNEVFATTVADFRQLGEVLSSAMRMGTICVAGPPEQLDLSNLSLSRLALP